MITLPADVYDTLELAAHAFGGIGAGYYFDLDRTTGEVLPNKPRCVHGVLGAAVGQNHAYTWLNDRVRNLGLTGCKNDDAVEAINRRNGKGLLSRVPFADYCQELGIVRGES
jgi:hypothetical protein